MGYIDPVPRPPYPPSPVPRPPSPVPAVCPRCFIVLLSFSLCVSQYPYIASLLKHGQLWREADALLSHRIVLSMLPMLQPTVGEDGVPPPPVPMAIRVAPNEREITELTAFVSADLADVWTKAKTFRQWLRKQRTALQR